MRSIKTEGAGERGFDGVRLLTEKRMSLIEVVLTK